MRKKIILFFLLMVMLSPMLTTGCWNRREINELAFVLASGVDRDPATGKFIVTVQIAQPSELASAKEGKGGGTKPFEVYSATGQTVFDAVRNLAKQVPRRLMWSHSGMVIIGEQTARAGVLPLIDFFERDHDLRRTNWVIVSQGEAKKALEAAIDLETLPARSLSGLLKYRAGVSTSTAVPLNDFLKALGSKSAGPVASWLEIIPAGTVEEKMLAEHPQGGKAEKKGEESLKPKGRLVGTAVFKGDKLAGLLNEPETRGFNWIKGKVVSGIIVVDCPRKKDGKVGIEIIEASSKIKPGIEDNEPVMDVAIEMEGNLGDQTCTDDLSKPETVKLLEKELAGVITGEARAVLSKTRQDYRSDILGFGEAVHKKFPRKWQEIKKHWDEIYPDLRVNVQAKAHIRRTGITTRPTKPK